METVSKSLEETQERTRKNEAAIADANQKIVQVDQKAGQAGQAATEARSAADQAANKAEAVEKASKRIVYETTLSEDQGNFKFGKANLPDEAKARLDEVVKQLKANPNGAFIEVEGYTDNRGDSDVQPAARSRARRGGQAVPLRGAPDSAAPHQRDQLRRRQADRAEQDQGRPREEPPRGRQGVGLGRSAFSVERRREQLNG